MQFILLSQNGYVILYNEIEIAFCFKKAVLLDLKIRDFSWKRGVFLAQNPRKGGNFQAWVRAWYTGVEGPG